MENRNEVLMDPELENSIVLFCEMLDVPNQRKRAAFEFAKHLDPKISETELEEIWKLHEQKIIKSAIGENKTK